MKETVGFEPPTRRPLGKERRAAAVAELVTTAALAVCTLVAALVISIGSARADPADNVLDHQGSLFAISLLLGLIFIGAGGVSAVLPRRKTKR